MVDVEEFIKMLGAVHKTSPFGYMFATPDEARNALARMGMIAPPSERLGLDISETDGVFGLFTGLNEAGLLFEGLEGDTDGYPANLSDIYETMDIRGVAGHYFLKPLARAIDGFKKGRKSAIERGADRAEKFIEEKKKEIFAEEEKKPMIVPPYIAYIGGRPAEPKEIVPYAERYLGGIPYQPYEKEPYVAKKLKNIRVMPIPNLEEIRNYFERSG